MRKTSDSGRPSASARGQPVSRSAVGGRRSAVGGWIHARHAPGEVGGDDRVADRMERDGETFLALPERPFAFAERRQQTVEAADQLADLVVLGDRQGMQRLAFIRHPGQRSRGDHQRRQLAAQYPPAQAGGEQGEHQRGQLHLALHVTHRREGVSRRQRTSRRREFAWPRPGPRCHAG